MNSYVFNKYFMQMILFTKIKFLYVLSCRYVLLYLKATNHEQIFKVQDKKAS